MLKIVNHIVVVLETRVWQPRPSAYTHCLGVWTKHWPIQGIGTGLLQPTSPAAKAQSAATQLPNPSLHA